MIKNLVDDVSNAQSTQLVHKHGKGFLPVPAKDILLNRQAFVAISAIIVLVLSACLYVFVTLPPRTIVMATGAKGGANYELGNRYREILAQSGVTVRLVPTSGAVETLAMLRDPRSDVSVGFIQGGTTNKEESSDLESLGTITYEPLWLFYRREITGGLQGLRGKRLSIGPEGSGGRALALKLISKIKLDSVLGEVLAFEPELAAQKLIAGEIDAAFIVAAWEAPVIQQLIIAKNIEVGSAVRADAFLAIYPFLNKLVLPAGVADLLTNRPPADVVLLAPKASLTVRSDLNSAIQHLLLNAAVQIHSRPGVFQKAGQFPAAESIDLPLSEEAQRFYKSGRPFLEKYLPFWLATLVERVLVVFIPLAAIMYPIVRFLPSAYDWLMQQRILRIYGEMKEIESELEARASGFDTDEIHERLERLDNRTNHLGLPTKYASTLYTLRSHLDIIHNRVDNLRDKKS